ncbi:MAG: hypothetical protein JNL22_01505 [Bacteroidales bacterium]|jgi:hypothetical protein|nr:hypothetical protein [Bacteroidales bacterium]
MKILKIKLDECLSMTEYDPSPHRVNPDHKSVTERSQMPIEYYCQNCHFKITLRLTDFEKHTKSEFSNLRPVDRQLFKEYSTKTEGNSFLDFYCPECKKATTIIYLAGPSGYGGIFEFQIMNVLMIE